MNRCVYVDVRIHLYIYIYIYVVICTHTYIENKYIYIYIYQKSAAVVIDNHFKAWCVQFCKKIGAAVPDKIKALP